MQPWSRSCKQVAARCDEFLHSSHIHWFTIDSDQGVWVVGDNDALWEPPRVFIRSRLSNQEWCAIIRAGIAHTISPYCLNQDVPCFDPCAVMAAFNLPDTIAEQRAVLAHLAHVQVCPAAATLGGTRERQRMLSNGCPALPTHQPFHHAVILIRFEQTAVQAVPFCGSAKHQSARAPASG